MALYSKDFSKVFSDLLQKSEVSCYKITQYTGLDQGYLSRLRNGVRSNPSPETIVRISLALVHYCGKVEQHDIERLFSSVGRSLGDSLE